MAIGITFAMRVTGAFGHEFIQALDDIAAHRGIGILVNGECRSGVGAENKAYSVFNVTFCNCGLYLFGYID